MTITINKSALVEIPEPPPKVIVIEKPRLEPILS